MRHRFHFAALLLFFCMALPLYAQRELLPASDPVYDFLFRQQLSGQISGYHGGMLPLSRGEVAAFLDSLNMAALSRADRDLLDEYRDRLSYDHTHSMERASSFLPSFAFGGIFDNGRQKYLYANADTSTAVFLDAYSWLGARFGKGDTSSSAHAILGEAGLRLRGTLMRQLGFFIQVSNGMLLDGSHDLALQDPRLRASRKFNADEKKFFDNTTGYLRYDVDWLAITAGREQLLWGMGYSDRMVFSNNAPPFDYFRIDLRSGGLRYSFLHGGLVSLDSTGHTAPAKYISSHRVEFDAGRGTRIGISEAVLYANQPPLYSLMNPLTFLTSAELSSEAAVGGTSDNLHNSIIWVDAEVQALRNLRVTGTWLIDDFSWKALGETSLAANTNKFGWQAGLQLAEPLAVGGLLVSLEYTRIGPFVGSHWTRVCSYTHAEQSLGQALPPNSDEWTLEAGYDISSRLRLTAKAQSQRSGMNVLDASGLLVYDAGSDILHGEYAIVHPNVFLDGTRVNRAIGSVTVSWQPLRQYFIDLSLFARRVETPSLGSTVRDMSIWTSFRIDY